MSDMQKLAAAEIVNPEQPLCEDAIIRRDVARDILRDLYIEVNLFAGIKVNDEALQAIESGEEQYHHLSTERMGGRFKVIEELIAQSEGATRDKKIAGLFRQKKVYGELAAPLYVTILATFNGACQREAEHRADHAKDERKLQAILSAKKPTKRQRRWLERKRAAM